MIGIGWQEIILLAVCGLPLLVGGIVLVAVLMSKGKTSREDQPTQRDE